MHFRRLRLLACLHLVVASMAPLWRLSWWMLERQSALILLQLLAVLLPVYGLELQSLQM